MSLASRRAVLLAGASAALGGCGVQTWVEQPGRRIFRHHTLYQKWDGAIVAFARGDNGFYSLESARESSGATLDLCKVDLDHGKATLLHRVEHATHLLAVSSSYVWLVLAADEGRELYLYRVSLTGPSVPEKLFRVPSDTFLVADAQGAWTYRFGRRALDLVRVTASSVETALTTVQPGELMVGPHGVFCNTDSGLHFLAPGGKPTRVADRGALPVVCDWQRALLSMDNHFVELELPSCVRGRTVGDASRVPGRPCAAMFGGVLFATAGSSSSLPGRPREVGVGLHLWEADQPGWDTVMDIATGPMLFGAPYGPSYLVATGSSVISVS